MSSGSGVADSGADNSELVESVTVDPELVARLETHSLHSWPPDCVAHGPHGWTLRATPGLDRGRSNHALTPSSTLSMSEYEAGIAAAADFAARWQIDLGLQVSPVDGHRELLSTLPERGWRVGPDVVVMAAEPAAVLACGEVEPLALTDSDCANADWLRSWAACEPERTEPRPGSDIESHVTTVFAKLAGRARFARFGELAVGITVEEDGVLGMFCLAVAPAVRRRGLGKGLVKGLLAGSDCGLAYLQVLSDNVAGLALYRSLGFEPAYRYCHCWAPAVG